MIRTNVLRVPVIKAMAWRHGSGPSRTTVPREEPIMTAPAETRICPFMSGGKENIFVICRGEECMAWYSPEHHAGEDALRPMPANGWCRLIEGKVQ